jgi:Domain of unknown function (DUF1905)
MKQFKTRLTSRGPGGAWTFFEVPFSVEEAFGSKARIAVSGTMNGFAFQNSLMPNGDGTPKRAETRTARAEKSIAMVLKKARSIVRLCSRARGATLEGACRLCPSNPQ